MHFKTALFVVVHPGINSRAHEHIKDENMSCGIIFLIQSGGERRAEPSPSDQIRSDQMGKLAVLCVVMVVTIIMQVEGDGDQMFKVGGLDAWALPPVGMSDLYKHWSANNKFKVGDSLLFLYPPSQDLVVQVREEAYSKCDISNPIAMFNDGNSLFNFNQSGFYYFTSGKSGHCAKSQKLAVAVADVNGALPPASSLNEGLGISPVPATAAIPTASASAGASATLMHPADSVAFVITLAFGLYMLIF